MNQNKRNLINNIMNALITIHVFDYNTAQDKKLVGYNYKNHQTVCATINKCKNLCMRDWNDYNILRDQSYESIYKTMIKISKDYSEDELKLIYNDINKKQLTITNQFLTAIYKLSVFDIKTQLSGSRKDGKQGMIPTFTYVEYTEDNLNDVLEVLDEEPNLDIVFFLQWFSQNKEKFLTPKQLEFLEDESITKTNKSSYRKRIYENTLKAYNAEFNNCQNERRNEITSAINYVEQLLDNPNFESVIINAMNKRRYVLDAITTYVSMPTMQRFNKGDHSKEVIKEYRTALFKKLNELNQLLEDVQ